MRYIAVEWLHDYPDEPILFYSELDEDRWELRKVEVFRDGTQHFADALHETDQTALSSEPIPSLEEIASDPEFNPKEISQAEFEIVWRSVTRPAQSD